jgi:hypothetical protein
MMTPRDIAAGPQPLNPAQTRDAPTIAGTGYPQNPDQMAGKRPRLKDTVVPEWFNLSWIPPSR